MTAFYLPEGLPVPTWEGDELQRPYWEGVQQEQLMIQRCGDCQAWHWGPEWMCHECRSLNMTWAPVEGRGIIYSWTRAWHPVHPALAGRGAYLAVLVELPDYGNVRMLGNLLGDEQQEVVIGAPVHAVFEHHPDNAIPHTLVQWELDS